MGSKTQIEWTDATWNPIIGCSRVSEGCRNCYAEGIAGRFGQGKQTVYSGLTQITNGRPAWTGKIVETKQLLQPLSWRRPKRVFVNSMSDLFHENVTDEQRDRIFAVMAMAPRHTFQVLTKRPERMREYCSSIETRRRLAIAIFDLSDTMPLRPGQARILPLDHRFDSTDTEPRFWATWPLPNVWLGVSVENQKAADERIPLLLKTPAAVRFISAEPLLGPVNLDELPSASGIGRYLDALSNAGVDPGAVIPSKLDWVIVGGESGPHARPMDPDWARGLRDQCKDAGVPYFFKQWGELWPNEQGNYACPESLRQTAEEEQETTHTRVGKKAAGALLDGREWREFPSAAMGAH